jgi:hypothetical protein
VENIKKLLVAAALASLQVQAPAIAGQIARRDPNEGCLVYSAGSEKFYLQFAFRYRSLAIDGDAARRITGEISPPGPSFKHAKAKNPDFTGDETGSVFIRCLPAGSYTVDSFSFEGVLPGVALVHNKSASPFSMPFHIRKGEATYLGSFMRAPSLGTSLRPILGARGYFVISDRFQRDFPIAQSRLPEEMTLTKEVTDVSVFNNPMLRTSDP